MISADQITGLILAGGRAQRMGGVDKGLIPFCGKPLIESVISRLSPQVSKIIINANRSITKYSVYGYPVTIDETPDFSGPLAGFAVGLKNCKTPYLLTSPCDTPLLPKDLVSLLALKLEQEKLQLAFASTRDPNGKVWSQPVFCLMRSDLENSLNTFLKNGDLKIDHWFKTLRTGSVLFEDELAFTNVNTPEELKALEEVVQ